MREQKSIYPNLEIEIFKTHRRKEEIARYLGIHPNTLTNKMTGKNDFTIGEMEDLRQYLSAMLDLPFTYDYLFRKEVSD